VGKVTCTNVCVSHGYIPYVVVKQKEKTVLAIKLLVNVSVSFALCRVAGQQDMIDVK
jgi:hypothetical protein